MSTYFLQRILVDGNKVDDYILPTACLFNISGPFPFLFVSVKRRMFPVLQKFRRVTGSQ